MTTLKRLVIDTNTVISALLLPTSIPRQAFDSAFAQGAVLVSVLTLAELTDVIQRRRFDKYIEEAARRQFLALFIQNTDLIEITETITDCRDAKDNKFLEVAVSGGATHLITGDSDLLDLHPYRGVAIVTPKTFLSLA
jgi:putative PIN family toxin of toxin-antitoxin system